MRKFRVHVNGSEYEVEIEEIGGGQSSSVPPPSPKPLKQSVSAPVAQTAAPPSTTSSANVASGAEKIITAQMPGTIIDIHVSAGDNVQRGQTLLILEAMKMANEVVAPDDGIVGEIKVTPGSSVNAGDVLILLT